MNISLKKVFLLFLGVFSFFSCKNEENTVVENLSQFYEGKTVVVVAHRLSTVLNASQIIVLNHGHVVEVGNHCSLIAKRGAYYQLIKNQLELGN